MKFRFLKKSLSMLAPMILFATLPGSYSSAANEDILVPPPRSVDDITAILDQQKRDNPEKVANAKKIAASSPPETDNSKKLAKFYMERAHASYVVSDSRQESADYAKVAELSQSKMGKAIALRQQSWAEARGGSGLRAIHISESALALARKLKPWIAVRSASWLATLKAKLGDIESAQNYLKEANRHKRNIQGFSNWSPMNRASLMNDLERSTGMILEAQGHLVEAELLYRKAIKRQFSYKDKRIKNKAFQENLPLRNYTWMLKMLSDNLVQQGRLVEAEVYAREAVLESLRVSGRNSDHTVGRLGTLTRAVFEQGRYGEAEQLARIAVDTLENLGAVSDSQLLAQARRDLADVLVAQENWPEALSEYVKIRDGLKDDAEIWNKLFAFNLNWATALLKTGSAPEVIAMLVPAYSRSEEVLGRKHYDTAEIGAFLGLAYAASGDHEKALGLLKSSFPLLLQRSRRTDNTQTTKVARAQRLEIIVEGYMELMWEMKSNGLSENIGIDAVAESFRLADIARDQSVQQALSATAARTASNDPELAELVREEQDSLRQIGALNGLLTNLLSIPISEQNPRVIKDLRKRIDNLRNTRGKQSEAVEKRFPEYAELINPAPAAVKDIRAHLNLGESLVAMYAGTERTFVWAIPVEGPIAFTAVEMGDGEFSSIVSWLRQALDPQAESLEDIPNFDVTAGYKIYQALLEPVIEGWRDADSLLIVAHGSLGQIPFGLLPTEAAELGRDTDGFFSRYRKIPWLIRSHALTVLPSSAAFSTLRRVGKSEQSRKPFAGFGDPIFSEEQLQITEASRDTTVRGVKLRSIPRTRNASNAQLGLLPRLPGTAEEVESIALVLNADPTRDLFLGLNANEQKIKGTDLSGYKVLAFATHGLVPGDLDGLSEPALALSSPELSKVEGDGLLTLSEILKLQLDADWVVLSACNTASGDGAGAEAISGLGRAFFYAGTRALLVSYWPVETTSAKALTTDLFRRQAQNPNLSRAQVLQQTILGLIDGPGLVDDSSGETLFTYAHPIFWAPFSIVGEGGS